MSNNVGMRDAREDDLISFISAFKYTRGASGNKPSWVFNYGKQADDAELVMAEALAAGNNPYDTVILPDVEAISDTEANILRQYVANGGNLIVTGPNPCGLDEYGTVRSNFALADLLGFSKGGALPVENENTHSSGAKMHFFSSLLGKDYFVSNDASALQKLSAAIQATSAVPLTTDADRRIHFELSHLDD